MTEEAIKQAEEELKSQSPTKVKRVPIGLNNTESKSVKESEKGKENEPKIEAKSSPTKDDVAVCCIEILSEFFEQSKLQEKIKARAERFGGFQSDDAKKAARAAKFGDMLGKPVKFF